MPNRSSPSASRFSASFPRRFAAALADAQGAIAGIAASAGDGGLAPDALRRLHEIYRLRVELEIETAGVLWRTAEVVAALADAIDVLGRRGGPGPGEGAPFLGSVTGADVERRRAGLTGVDGAARRRASWPEFAGRNPVPDTAPAQVLPLPPAPSGPADAARAA